MSEPVSRLFVDVDETLIRWRGEGFMLTHEPNEPVVAYVRRWRNWHPGRQVIVWSNAGEAWAREQGARCLPDVPHIPRAKFEFLPRELDTFLDDDPLSWYTNVVDPRQIEAKAELQSLKSGGPRYSNSLPKTEIAWSADARA